MLEKKKILIVSDYFGNKTTTFIYNEVLGLVDDYEVKYLCVKQNNQDEFPFDNVVVIPFEENRVIRKLKWWLEIYDLFLSFWNPKYAKDIDCFLDDFKPDLIHCHFGYEALRFYQNFNRTKFPFIPIVVSFRGHDASFHLKRKSYVNALRVMLNDPKVYTTFVCEFLKEMVVKSGLPVREHLILYSGTKTNYFKRLSYNYEHKPFIFLQVAHFELRKGQLETLYAFKNLLDEIEDEEKPILVLAGGGPTLETCKLLSAELKIDEYVLFPGWVNPSQTKNLLENAHIFVHHSITENCTTEGIPNALMEAMSMELPVISTFHAGIPELIDDEIDGILTKEKDITHFSSAMKLSLSHKKYSEKNRRRIIEKFDFVNHMENLTKFYTRILEKR